MHAWNNGNRLTTATEGKKKKKKKKRRRRERGENGDVISRLVCRTSKEATVNGVGVFTPCAAASVRRQILELTGH